MVLVNQQDVVKMNFNSERRMVESVADFMRIYLIILQLAFHYNFITENQRDSIANAVLMTVRNIAKEDEILVSNYVYAISLRFSKLSNFECWELLREVNSKDAAEKFVLETKEWFLKRMLEDLRKAKKGYEKSQKLKNAGLLSTWRSCYRALQQLSGCFKEDSKLELKGIHTESVVGTGGYIPLQDEGGYTYIDKMENYIQNLWMETSILIKFDASKIMKAISKEREDAKVAFQSMSVPQIEEARARYDRAVAALAELEASYAEKLKYAEESEYIYDELLEKFEAEHPEMEEEELADAFDEYWANYSEYCSEEISDVEDMYHQKRIELQEEINICRRNMDLAEDSKAEQENAVEQPDDDVSLMDILNEYAVVELFKQGQIRYPQNAIEKAALFATIPTKEAIKIFLQNEADRIHLTAEERTYLLC